jgi:hypothetical protein
MINLFPISGLALSIECSGIGFYLKTETEFILGNVVLKIRTIENTVIVLIQLIIFVSGIKFITYL